MNNYSYEGDKMNIQEIDIINLSEFYKMFSDPTRLKILNLLLNKEMCVKDIADDLDMTHSSISHQLKLLRTANFVKYKRLGKEIYYSLADKHIEIILKYGVEHTRERGKYE